MSWIENEQSASFEYAPIIGLFFLSGNQAAYDYNRDWTEGQKYPMIAFPSGVECALWETSRQESVAIVHLFGEMDLPLGDNRDRAYQQAQHIAEQCGYVVKKVDEDKLEVWGHDRDEHALIIYDEHAKRMVDVIPVKEGQRPKQPLLDEESRERLPPLYANENIGLDAIAQVKFFTPDSNWTWYASEFDGEDIFFGLVVGFEVELGYFSLSELEEVQGPLGLSIEREKFFKPTSLRELQRQHLGE